MDVVFHVVTSVKGGSGKSTVALFLADYLSHNKEDAYVIDLDVCGTSWLTDYSFAFDPTPTKFINRMIYQSCTKGYGEDVWSNLNVCGAGDTKRTIKVCLAANEQLSHSINKSEAELIEHTTYHLIMDAIQQSKRAGNNGNEKIHVIFDLPPSHETTVEQICHHLLFDQRSVLKRELAKCEIKSKVNFYMVSPADQGSALIKNIDYIKGFKSNPTYSESLMNENWSAWLFINDNHNWVGAQGDSVTGDLKSGLKKGAKIIISTKKLEGILINVLVMDYKSFGYKKGYIFGEYKANTVGLTEKDVREEDKKRLNISEYDESPFETIYNELKAN